MKTLILTDNPRALDLARELAARYGGISIHQSPHGSLEQVPAIDVRTHAAEIIENFQLVISLHCKQIFPPELIRKVRCVNVHPGFNPFNRGWVPHVFSIINGMKAGVTIHEIDAHIDHGSIILQREYRIKSWDTSGSAYSNIMKLERDLLLEHFPSIRDGAYRASPPAAGGNINYKKDYEKLKPLDLNQSGTFRDFLNRLRALTHEEYRNAFFVDEEGNRVFVRVILEVENP